MSLFKRQTHKKARWGILLVVMAVVVGVISAAFAPQRRGVSETYDPTIDNVRLLPIRDARLQRALRLMLNSDTKWQSLDVRARYTEYAYQANMQDPSSPSKAASGKTTFIEEIHLRKPWSATYRQFLEGDSQPRYQVTLQGGKLQEIPPDDASEEPATSAASTERLQRELALLPRSLEEIHPGYIIDHPLVRVIPARSMDMLFPTWIAQQATTDNKLSYEGQETLLGRTVWRIRLVKSGDAIITAWVDTQTGILLRFRYEVAGNPIATCEVLALNTK